MTSNITIQVFEAEVIHDNKTHKTPQTIMMKFVGYDFFSVVDDIKWYLNKHKEKYPNSSVISVKTLHHDIIEIIE